MAYNKGLAERIRHALVHRSDIEEKKMFGGVGFMLKGNMACGVNKDDLIIRVGPGSYDEAVIRPHTRPFDMTGRPMRGWVVVEPPGYVTNEDLKKWIDQGVSFALSLPPK